MDKIMAETLYALEIGTEEKEVSYREREKENKENKSYS